MVVLRVGTSPRSPALVANDRVSFDLDQHVGINQGCHFDHRCGRADFPKGLTVRPANVHVKAIGSGDNEFKSGDTDLRGIFVAEGLNGSATVIAPSTPTVPLKARRPATQTSGAASAPSTTLAPIATVEDGVSQKYSMPRKIA